MAVDPKEVQAVLADALAPFLAEGLHLAVVGIGYTDSNGNLVVHGQTYIPRPPRDHEEEILRNNAAKRISEFAAELMNTVYN